MGSGSSSKESLFSECPLHAIADSPLHVIIPEGERIIAECRFTVFNIHHTPGVGDVCACSNVSNFESAPKSRSDNLV